MPRSEYMQFIKQFRLQHPELSSTDQIKLGAQEWRKMTGKPKGPKRVKKPKLCPICQNPMRKPRTAPFICPECKKKLPKNNIKGGFIGSLMASALAPVAYQYAIKPGLKAIGAGIQKKKRTTKKKTTRRTTKKGGLMYLPIIFIRVALIAVTFWRGGLMYPPGV